MDMIKFENAMIDIIGQLGVEYDTTDSEDYGTLKAITDYYNSNRRLMVWTGGSDNTIFSTPEFNWMFRAWHDHHHVKHQHEFTTKGERLVCDEQIKDVLRYVENLELQEFMIMILNAEINGQVEEFNKTGGFVDDQKQFTVEYIQKTYDKTITL